MQVEQVCVIYETVHGSRAYGLAGPDSDVDRRGVFIPPRESLLGFETSPEQMEPEPERVLFDIRKFFRLGVACNPSILEVLFTDPAEHVVVSPLGRRLLDERDGFLSRLAGDSFGRYGLAQLQRIRTHRRWLLHPPAAKPERRAFGLPERSVIPSNQQGAAEALLSRGDLVADALAPGFMDVLDRERRYRAAHREWQQHQEWLERRNPARAELERRFGYDTKHAMHLVRLLRMAAEILEQGRVIVRRPDAGELLDIRRGSRSFDQLLEHAEDAGARLPALAERSPLPPRPDVARMNRLCAELVGATLRGL